MPSDLSDEILNYRQQNNVKHSKTVTNDIVQFIEQESLNKKQQSQQIVIETYACTLWKGFFDMKHKLRKVEKLQSTLAVDMGIQLIDNLFWILYHYSSNLQLTLFLTERGRLLYTEFLYMSRTHQLMKELQSYPTIQDAFQFAIKKSIGSLTCKEQHPTNQLLSSIHEYRSMYRRMFKHINRKYLQEKSNLAWTNDELNLTLHNLNHKMSIAASMNYIIFHKFVHNARCDDITLTEFLLSLQLISCTIITSSVLTNSAITERNDNCITKALLDIFEFVYNNQNDLDETLNCLESHHNIQKKWILHRVNVIRHLNSSIISEHTVSN